MATVIFQFLYQLILCAPKDAGDPKGLRSPGEAGPKGSFNEKVQKFFKVAHDQPGHPGADGHPRVRGWESQEDAAFVQNKAP